MTDTNKMQFEIKGDTLKSLSRIALLKDCDEVEIIVYAFIFYKRCYEEFLKEGKVKIHYKDGTVKDCYDCYFEQ